MKITSRYGVAVLWEGECENIREELIVAVKSGANLYGANLYGANLYGANLSRANLSDVTVPPMDSHVFWSELLLRAAGDDLHRRGIAGLVAVSTDWCWPRMIALIAGELSQDWQSWAGAIFWHWPEQCRMLGLPEVVSAEDAPAGDAPGGGHDDS